MTKEGKAVPAGGKGVLDGVASAMRRSPGLFYLAMALAIFLVLYIGVSVSTGRKPAAPPGNAAEALEAMTQSMPKTPGRR